MIATFFNNANAVRAFAATGTLAYYVGKSVDSTAAASAGSVVAFGVATVEIMIAGIKMVWRVHAAASNTSIPSIPFDTTTDQTNHAEDRRDTAAATNVVVDIDSIEEEIEMEERGGVFGRTSTALEVAGGDDDVEREGDEAQVAPFPGGVEEQEEEEEEEPEEEEPELLHQHTIDDREGQYKWIIDNVPADLPINGKVHHTLGLAPPDESGRIILFLDADECLFRTSERRPETQPDAFRIQVQGHVFYVLPRPGLLEFMEWASSKFEVVLFTAGVEEYAEAILNHLDPDVRLFHHCLSRDDCFMHNGTYMKDLRPYCSDFRRCVMVDNRADVLGFQPENGVTIASFLGDSNDRGLFSLRETLEQIADCRHGDVRLYPGIGLPLGLLAEQDGGDGDGEREGDEREVPFPDGIEEQADTVDGCELSPLFTIQGGKYRGMQARIVRPLRRMVEVRLEDNRIVNIRMSSIDGSEPRKTNLLPVRRSERIAAATTCTLRRSPRLAAMTT